MKTKEIPALVMLLAGGVYCLIGIYYQIPFMDFSVQLLIVLLVFWMIGGIVRLVLDRFMGEIGDKTEAGAETKADENDAKTESKEEKESEVEKESEEEEPDFQEEE